MLKRLTTEEAADLAAVMWKCGTNALGGSFGGQGGIIVLTDEGPGHMFFTTERPFRKWSDDGYQGLLNMERKGFVTRLPSEPRRPFTSTPPWRIMAGDGPLDTREVI